MVNSIISIFRLVEERLRQEDERSGKKSSHWSKIESASKMKEKDPAMNHYYRPETFGPTETKPDQLTLIRPSTAAGHKKKVTIHDL